MFMIDDILENVKKRNRRISVSLSYNLINEIRGITRDNISFSLFVRLAVIKELERLKKDG